MRLLVREDWDFALLLQLFPAPWQVSDDPRLQAIKIEVHDGRGVDRKHLAHHQSADYRDAQGAPQFRSRARTEGQWNSTEQCGCRGHHDRTEAQQCRFVNGIERSLSLAL